MKKDFTMTKEDWDEIDSINKMIPSLIMEKYLEERDNMEDFVDYYRVRILSLGAKR